jgi:inosine-uridine nucleoside N-ribohydrolase
MSMKILVETKGEYTTGLTLALPAKQDDEQVKVCVDVDVNRFKKLFMEIICAK